MVRIGEQVRFKVIYMTENEKLLKKLEERFANGEISEEIYKELKEGLEKSSPPEKPAAPTPPRERSEKISISGAGKLSGPIYAEVVKVSGAGKIDGDVDALQVKSSGSMKITGNVKSEEVKCSGALKVEGDVSTKIFRNSGGGKIVGRLDATEVKNSGSLNVEGPIVAKELIEASGSLDAQSLESEEIRLSGAFKVENHIKADDIKIDIAGNSSAKSIEGDYVEVRPGSSNRWGRWLSSGGTLKVDTIKGKELRLENVKADLVEGDNVEIGPGCNIKEARAKSLRVHEDAKVNKRTKL